MINIFEHTFNFKRLIVSSFKTSSPQNEWERLKEILRQKDGFLCIAVVIYLSYVNRGFGKKKQLGT
jgi:hypothetical protein